MNDENVTVLGKAIELSYSHTCRPTETHEYHQARYVLLRLFSDIRHGHNSVQGPQIQSTMASLLQCRSITYGMYIMSRVSAGVTVYVSYLRMLSLMRCKFELFFFK